MDSTGIRNEGNKAVKNLIWAEAQRLYTSAIEAASTPEETRLVRLNRSRANLKLGRCETALSDAITGSETGSPSEKSLFRQARALYDLGHFHRCMGTLHALFATYPGNAATEQEMKRVEQRLHEQKTGDYNFHHLNNQAKRNPPLIDCATYSAPVEVRASPGRGSGLFTTTAISDGQLLLCEKAFTYSFVGEDDESKRNRVLI